MSFRRPYMLLCGTDNVKRFGLPSLSSQLTQNSTASQIDNEPDLPLWAQVCIAILRTQMFPGLVIDVFASVAPGRDAGTIKETIMAALDPEFADVNVDGITATSAQSAQEPVAVVFKDHYTYACLCGVEPTSAIPENMRVIYIATKSVPLHASFPFNKLGPSGIIVLQEKEARGLLREFDPDVQPDRLTGRKLVRALVAQPSLESIRGVVVTYGEQALDGCVASINIDEIMDDDEDEWDEDEDEEVKKERWEFDIVKAIIGPDENIIPEGAYAAFLGKLISSIYIEGVNSSYANYTENQFSFQLEQSCVAAASTALAPGKSRWDLPSRIPGMNRLSDNLTRYINMQRMLRGDEDAPPVRRGAKPPRRPKISWRAPVQTESPSKASGSQVQGKSSEASTAPKTGANAEPVAQEASSARSRTPNDMAGFKRGFLKGMF